VPTGPDKRQMHGWVTPEAMAGWRGFAKANSTNVTALMEAFGHLLARAEEQPINRMSPLLREVVREAQRVAGDRSTRTPT
jgi:hypothetical protein